jgi:hypothetical protein
VSGTLVWYDYYLQFPISGITLALQFLAQVRAAGFMGGSGHLPDNMLGDKRSMDGSLYVQDPTPDAPDTHAFCGRPGIAAYSYTDPDTGLEVDVPAAGDPTIMYVQVRSPVSQAQSAALQTSLGISPATFGITPANPAVCALVLGVWAS